MTDIAERARARADALRDEAAALLREVLPGVRVEAEGDGIRLTGRHVARRWRAIQADHLLRSHLR